MSEGFSSHENLKFLRMCENMYRSMTATNRKEQGRERSLCRLVIVECGLRL